MTKVYGFDEPSYRRVREASRRTLNSPRKGAQRRRQPPVVGGGGGSFEQYPVIVTDEVDGIYKIQIREWNSGEGEWETNEGETYDLDPSELGAEFSVGQKLVAFWHPEREMFMPVAKDDFCESENTIIHLTVIGSPTGGTFSIDLNVNSSNETLSFGFDDDTADVTTELETHTEIGSGDVSVSGGDFPDATIAIEFTGNLANTPIELPEADWSSLTGGAGVAVIASYKQRGFA